VSSTRSANAESIQLNKIIDIVSRKLHGYWAPGRWCDCTETCRGYFNV